MNPARNLHLMIQTGVIEHLKHRARRSGLRIGCSIDKPLDAGMDHGSRAHGAGFEGDIKLTAGKPIVVAATGSGAHGHDLSVCRGIEIAEYTVLASSNDLAIEKNDGPHGNLAGIGR